MQLERIYEGGRLTLSLSWTAIWMRVKLNGSESKSVMKVESSLAGKEILKEEVRADFPSL